MDGGCDAAALARQLRHAAARVSRRLRIQRSGRRRRLRAPEPARRLVSLEIPYSAEPRPDTGVSNATLGMWLFIASEVMLFGSLFSSYVLLRLGAASWPDQGATLNVPLASVNTVVLVLSSILITRASRSAAAARASAFRIAMAATVV